MKIEKGIIVTTVPFASFAQEEESQVIKNNDIVHCITDKKDIVGRVVDISDACITIDYSEPYHGKIDPFFFKDILYLGKKQKIMAFKNYGLTPYQQGILSLSKKGK